MAASKISNGLRDYFRQKEETARIAGAYYRKLIKFTILLSVVPTIVLGIMVVYERLSLTEGVLGVGAVLIGSVFFARPYMEDLAALRSYVEKLAMDRHVTMPSLSFLGSVEELSRSVQNLHHSWEEKKIRLEAAIAESRILFDTIPDILLMLGRDMRIIRANKAAQNMFGRNLDGINLNLAIKEPVLKDLIVSVMEDKRSESVELAITSHNVKRDFQISIERFPLYSIGGIAVVVVMHDVTEAKKTRQMIKDFVANASHEIRTPLTSIAGFLENLKDMDDDAPTRKKFLGIMSEQADRMGTLVNDLLSLSKVEMNESTIPTDKIDICPIIESSIRRLEHLASQKNMKIKYQENGAIPEIFGDSNELSQVFTNLVGNAIKYGYENTDIEVIVGVTDYTPLNSEHHIFKHSKAIAVAVRDEGEGIPEEHLHRITERFYRVDKTRSRNIGGTGLGLSIVKHIMNRHRGELAIKSEENKGSIFTVYFPAEGI